MICRTGPDGRKSREEARTHLAMEDEHLFLGVALRRHCNVPLAPPGDSSQNSPATPKTSAIDFVLQKNPSKAGACDESTKLQNIIKALTGTSANERVRKSLFHCKKEEKWRTRGWGIDMWNLHERGLIPANANPRWQIFSAWWKQLNILKYIYLFFYRWL